MVWEGWSREAPPYPELPSEVNKIDRETTENAEFLLTPPRARDYTHGIMKPGIPRHREDTSGKAPYKGGYGYGDGDARRRSRT